jgi:hypothetical protein
MLAKKKTETLKSVPTPLDQCAGAEIEEEIR